MKRGSVLLVDDNKSILQAWSLFLKPYDAQIGLLVNPELLLKTLATSDYDLVLLDMNFKAGMIVGNEGLYWLKKIHEQNPHQSVIVITAYGDIKLAVEAMKLGAIDFVHKDWDEEKILSSIQAGIRMNDSKREIEKLKQTRDLLQNRIDTGDLIIHCPSKAMKPVYDTIEKVAKTDAHVLLLGENGIGKEVLALKIHQLSDRKHENFIPIDLGSITDTLFESELFGYVKGAFTDAIQDKPGRMELASGGTLFLDEIANLSFMMQAKLLSVIQSKQVCRVGSVTPRPVDFRLICATNRDLSEAIRERSFREDLFFRINTISIEIPPLRERMEDIQILASHFLEHYNHKYQKELKLHPAAIKSMQSYAWPGNIRELKHTLEKGVILTEKAYIMAEQLFGNQKPLSKYSSGHTLNLQENEVVFIRMALNQCRWNMTQAASKLGINRSTLYEKIHKYGIEKD